MPEISRFLGIVIAMYHADHAPPHIHAKYGGQEAVIHVRPPMLVDGHLPPRVLGLVMEWIGLNQDAILADWDRARLRQPLHKIPPLT